MKVENSRIDGNGDFYGTVNGEECKFYLRNGELKSYALDKKLTIVEELTKEKLVVDMSELEKLVKAHNKKCEDAELAERLAEKNCNYDKVVKLIELFVGFETDLKVDVEESFEEFEKRYVKYPSLSMENKEGYRLYFRPTFEDKYGDKQDVRYTLYKFIHMDENEECGYERLGLPGHLNNKTYKNPSMIFNKFQEAIEYVKERKSALKKQEERMIVKEKIRQDISDRLIGYEYIQYMQIFKHKDIDAHVVVDNETCNLEIGGLTPETVNEIMSMLLAQR